MLRIYLGKADNSVVKYNDTWFDNYINDIKFDDTVVDIIKSIDGVDYVKDYKVKSKFNHGTVIGVNELSTGCKTAINVYTFKDKIFTAGECGDNALQAILGLKQGNIHIPYFIVPREFANSIEIIDENGNLKQIVNNNRELEEILYDYF